MPDSLLKRYQRNSLSQFFSAYWSICGLLHRKHDLEQLKTWAIRKGLSNPQQLYARRSIDIEQRLWYWQCRAPRVLTFAECAVHIARLFSGKEQYRKGYASRLRN